MGRDSLSRSLLCVPALSHPRTRTHTHAHTQTQRRKQGYTLLSCVGNFAERAYSAISSACLRTDRHIGVSDSVDIQSQMCAPLSGRKVFTYMLESPARKECQYRRPGVPRSIRPLSSLHLRLPFSVTSHIRVCFRCVVFYLRLTSHTVLVQ